MSEPRKPSLRVRETSIGDLGKLAVSGHLYAIVDSCRVPTTPKKALELGEQRAISLYRETTEQDFWDVAPYLFSLDSALLDWTIDIASAEGWGIFVASTSDLRTLRHHFRHLLKVHEPEGDVWYFRFYDPRVLRPFLPACTEQELRAFFGPVLAYGIAERHLKNVEFIQEETSRDAPASHPSNPTYGFMFRLRNEHVESLRPQAEMAFVTRLVQYVRREFPEAVDHLVNELLIRRVQFGVLSAKHYGLRWEQDIALFVALMFEFAPDYDRNPHVQRILAHPNLNPDLKMSLVVDEISDEEWEQIEHKLNAPWNSICG